MYYIADVEVKVTFLEHMVIDAVSEAEVERFFMEDADFDYNDFTEIGVPTIKVKNIKRFGIK